MSTHEHERLLDVLSENSLIKAALILDQNGHLKGRRGTANILRKNHETMKLHAGSSADAAGPPEPTAARENVYMVEMLQDVLVVVFEEGVEFERLRTAVDVLLKHTGMEKSSESDANPPSVIVDM